MKSLLHDQGTGENDSIFCFILTIRNSQVHHRIVVNRRNPFPLQFERAETIYYLGSDMAEYAENELNKYKAYTDQVLDDLRLWPEKSFEGMSHFDTKGHFQFYLTSMRMVSFLDLTAPGVNCEGLCKDTCFQALNGHKANRRKSSKRTSL